MAVAVPMSCGRKCTVYPWKPFGIIGAQKGRLNDVTVQLFGNLAVPGGGMPVLRIGGNSQDQAWWNPEGLARPRPIQIDLGPAFFGKLEQFLERIDGKSIIGLNLAINDPTYPVTLAQNVMQIVPPKHVMRPSVRRASDLEGTHDLVAHPLAAPTGPGGAQGFEDLSLVTTVVS